MAQVKEIVLGTTQIKTPQNGFGALPIQRDDMNTAVEILRKAYEGGMTFFDTARAYSDSEEKIGEALSDVRDNIYIATKSPAKNPDDLKRDLETSLDKMKTDHVDIFQFHQVNQCYKPEDGTGMYEAMEDFKRQGMIRHIGITTHKIGVAEEIVNSDLYETLQYPFSYLASDRDLALVASCREHHMGFIAMKGLAGGLINNSRAAFAFMNQPQFDHVIPIWGVQRIRELDEWLSYMEDAPVLDDDLQAVIDHDKTELSGDFCRGCGYCMPCPQGITINQCARMSLMIRRAPSENWLSEYWQKEMARIDNCIGCGSCRFKCPYELDTPNLLKKNLADYRAVLAGKASVEEHVHLK